jgi:hypothetical protein
MISGFMGHSGTGNPIFVMATGRHDTTRATNKTLATKHGTPSIEIEKQADSAPLDPKLFNAVECYHRFLQDPVNIHVLS